MKLLKKYNQNRRDCDMDIKCEHCGSQEVKVCAYDDRNFWDNVLPNMECDKCGKNTKDINPQIKQNIATKYAEGKQV